MRKSPIWRGEQWISAIVRPVVLIPLVSFGILLPPRVLRGQTPAADPAYRSEQGFGTLIQSQIRRLQAEVERTRELVANGTIARVQLQRAEETLADAQDQGILAETLYSAAPVEKLTQSQADAMMTAAHRRFDRQNLQVEERRRLLEGGAISQSEFDAIAAEAEDRRRVLTLAENRVKLLEDLHHMAETEKLAERASSSAPATLRNSMIRYSGNGQFSLADVPAISAQFERRFHYPLPVSALGQTLLHQSLGLDHRNRVDVAINPGSGEGIWLRSFLETLHVPYLAFSNAVAGAATAPHIHIGVESTRLKPGIGG